jgi:hypothetical protein
MIQKAIWTKNSVPIVAGIGLLPGFEGQECPGLSFRNFEAIQEAKQSMSMTISSLMS